MGLFLFICWHENKLNGVFSLFLKFGPANKQKQNEYKILSHREASALI